MNRKQRRKPWVAAVAMLAAVILLVSACGGGGGGGANATTTTAATTTASTTAAATSAAATTTQEATTTALVTTPPATTSQAATAGADTDMMSAAWDTPYPETITISTANIDKSVREFPEGDSVDDNVWYRIIKDRLNIQLTNMFISAEYETAMNLAIASGDLPDVFYVTNPQYKQVVDAGLVWDITDVHEALSSDYLRTMNETDISVLEAAKVNGRLYGQPRLGWGNNIDRPPYMWIRHDWMEEQGFSKPETIEELENIIRTMNEAYGSKGMAVEKKLDYLLLIASSWHAYPKIWVDTPNGIEYGGIQPEMKAVMEHWARWYAEGLIAPEFAAKDEDAMNQDLVNSVHCAQPGWQWFASRHMSSVQMNGPEAYLDPYLVPTIDGQQQMVPIQFDNGNEVIVVNKNCQYPEALMKLMNMYVYVNNEMYTAENLSTEEFEVFMDGDMQHFLPFRVNNPFGEHQQYLEVQNVLANNRDTSLFTIPVAANKYFRALEWMDDADPNGLGSAMQVGIPEICCYAQAEPYFLNNWFTKSKIWGPDPEALLRYKTSLDALLIEGYTKLIMGVEPIDYFDQMVEEWKAAGGAEATAAVNEQYGS